MADLKAQFEQAQADVKTLTNAAGNEDMLTLYALFKQGSRRRLRLAAGMLGHGGARQVRRLDQAQGHRQGCALQKYIDKLLLLKTHK